MYAFGLCLFFGLVFTCVDFYFYRKKIHRLELQKKSIAINSALLSEAGNQIEKEYQALISILMGEKNRIQTNADQTKQDMKDYYTMWVHQIKTPIAAMTLLLQEQSEVAPELKAELFKIEQYVEMVLSYFRIDSESTDYLFQWYDVNDIIKQCIRKYAKLFIIKRLSLTYSEVDYKVLTDQKWLSFIIEQILSNALKYTNCGGITITVSENKTIEITDTGIGIAQEDITRVFEEGFTGFNGRNEKKSTGLGLYLCKRIANPLGIKLQIQSQVDQGTHVILQFDNQCFKQSNVTKM